jgi:hypothetical protein
VHAGGEPFAQRRHRVGRHGRKTHVVEAKRFESLPELLLERIH